MCSICETGTVSDGSKAQSLRCAQAQNVSAFPSSLPRTKAHPNGLERHVDPSHRDWQRAATRTLRGVACRDREELSKANPLVVSTRETPQSKLPGLGGLA